MVFWAPTTYNLVLAGLRWILKPYTEDCCNIWIFYNLSSNLWQIIRTNYQLLFLLHLCNQSKYCICFYLFCNSKVFFFISYFHSVILFLTSTLFWHFYFFWQLRDRNTGIRDEVSIWVHESLFPSNTTLSIFCQCGITTDTRREGAQRRNNSLTLIFLDQGPNGPAYIESLTWVFLGLPAYKHSQNIHRKETTKHLKQKSLSMKIIPYCQESF